MSKRDLWLFLCVATLFLPVSGAYGSEIPVNWTGSAGDSAWTTANNWNPTGAPNNGANTYGVTVNGAGTVNLVGAFSIDSLAMTSSVLNMSTGGSNSLALGVAASTLTGAMIVGGTLTNNGTLTLSTAQFVNSPVLDNFGTLSTAAGSGSTLSGTVTNEAGAAINVVNESALQLQAGGTYTNNGTINLASSGTPTQLELSSGSGNTVNLQGSGSLTLSNNADNDILETTSGLTLQNGPQHAIQGAGTIGDSGFSLVNQGGIVANQSAGLTVHAGSIVNTGQISVTAGNILGITYGTFNNTGGTLLDNGGTLTLHNGGGGYAMLTGGNVSVINGGTLTAPTSTALSGVNVNIDSTSNASLSGVVADASNVTNHGTLTLSGTQFFNNPVLDNFGTVNTAVSTSTPLGGTLINEAGATINVVNGSALQLQAGGTYTNNGTINVASTGGPAYLQLAAGTGSTVALGGTGSLTLSNNANNSVGELGPGMTLQNGAQHTIQGAGTIGDSELALVNQGSIVANQSAGLTITAGSITNTGQISVTAGNTLGIAYGTFNNAGGTLLDNGGTMTLQNGGGGYATLTGGQVDVLNGGTLRATAGTALSGVTVNIDSTSNASLSGIIADGSNVTNHGTVTLDDTRFFNNPVLDNFGSVNTAIATSTPLGGTVINEAGATINVVNESALQLQAGGTYLNNGTINIGSTGAPTYLQLSSGSGNTVTLEGSGSLTLSNNVNNSIGEIGGGLTLVNGPQHTIQGAGTIGDSAFSLVNQGSIIANQSAGLTITAGSITNPGQISVTAGNSLGITYGSFNNAGGTLLDNGGALALHSGGGGYATLTGGNIDVVNGGTLTASSGTVLSGVTVAIDSTSNASLSGIVADASHVTNHGTLTFGGAQFFNNPVLDNFGTLDGIAGGGPASGVATLTNEAGAAIDVASGSVVELSSGATFTNNGTLNVAAGGVFVTDSGANFTNYSGHTLTGGAYDIAGQFDFAGADIVTNQAAITLSGSGQIMDSSSTGQNGLRDFSTNGSQGQFTLSDAASFQSSGDFNNSGTVTIDAGAAFEVGSTWTNNYIEDGGTTVLNGGLYAGAVELTNGGELSGTGEMFGTLENAGIVQPGDDPGTLTVEGNYVQDSTGVLNIELDSATDYSMLNISGSAQLDGTLNMLLGFMPAEYEQFTIMNFSSRNGDFAVINTPGNWIEIWGTDSLTMEYVTPEPATWALLAAALVGLAWFRRRAAGRA